MSDDILEGQHAAQMHNQGVFPPPPRKPVAKALCEPCELCTMDYGTPKDT